MIKYCLIKKTELVQEQLNFSVSEKVEHLTCYVSTAYLIGVFPLATEYYILEFGSEVTKETSVFNALKWYTKEEMQTTIDNNTNSQV